jgi:hypothetical protein
MSVSIKMTAFWDIALCSLIEVDWEVTHHPDVGGCMHLWNIY